MPVDESGRLAEEAGQSWWRTGSLIARATLRGLRGEAAAAERLVAEAEKTAVSQGLNDLICMIAFARAVTWLGAGRPACALEHVTRVFDGNRRVSESRLPLRAARQVSGALGCLPPWGNARVRSCVPLASRAESQFQPRVISYRLRSFRSDSGEGNDEPRNRSAALPLALNGWIASVPAVPKLGVTSRNQLAGALDMAGEAPTT